MGEASAWVGVAFHAGGAAAAKAWVFRGGEQGQGWKARPGRVPVIQAEFWFCPGGFHLMFSSQGIGNERVRFAYYKERSDDS